MEHTGALFDKDEAKHNVAHHSTVIDGDYLLSLTAIIFHTGDGGRS
jgi:hypothetical protein